MRLRLRLSGRAPGTGSGRRRVLHLRGLDEVRPGGHRRPRLHDGDGCPAQAAIITEFAYNDKGLRNLYLLLDPTIDYEKQFCAAGKQRWEELGGTVVGEDTFQQGDESIASQITRLKGLDPQPEAILLCSYQPGASAALRQLRAAGIETAVIGGEDQDGSYWLEAVPDLNELYYVTYGSIFGDDPDPKVDELVTAYTEQFGEPPATAHFLTGYSVIEVWAQAVEQAGTTEGAAVRDALQSLQDAPLLVGPTSFSPSGTSSSSARCGSCRFRAASRAS